MSDKVNTLNALRLASLRSKGYTAEQIAALAETLQGILEDINTSLEECENHVQSPHAPATAEENDIVSIKRNGVVVAPTDKVVDILVPTKVSELTNDSQFATVQQVQSEVAGSGHLSSEVVNTLPSPQEAQPNTIYFVLQNNAGDGNQYIEYMLINGALEAIGYGNADLSGYVTEDYVAKADDSLMEDIFNQTSPIQEKYVGTGNLVAFWGFTKDLLNEMEAVQNDLASDIELLELCVTNRPVEGNPFVVTFETLNNLDVEGVWETANKRISF